MLTTEVYQSYYSIVSPNEAKPFDNSTDEILESKNFVFLMKKYLEVFVLSQPYIGKRRK